MRRLIVAGTIMARTDPWRLEARVTVEDLAHSKPLGSANSIGMMQIRAMRPELARLRRTDMLNIAFVNINEMGQ